MAIEAAEESKPWILLVAGPGLGHVNGCLLLSRSLAEAGKFSVALVCFERSYKTHESRGRLKRPHPSVRLEVLPDGQMAGSSSSGGSYLDLFTTTPEMMHSLENLVRELSPVAIVADTIMGWTQDVADKFDIPRVDYWTATASCYLCILALPQIQSRGYLASERLPPVLDCVPGFPNFPSAELPRDFLSPSPMLDSFLSGAPRAKKARSVLIHSAYDLESAAFDGLRQIGVRAYDIGPLLRDPPSENSAASLLTWLDQHQPESVIYVAFGSNAVLHVDEIGELAHGLEASGQPFLWVLRSDAIQAAAPNGRDVEVSSILPPGFLTRTAHRGLIVSWAPQLVVLGHPAVGGFFSHCGWNSTLESLWMGVPILACPRSAEQPTNCRLITSLWEAGLRLHVDESSGRIGHAGVESGVRELIVGAAGQKARANARKLRGTVRTAVLPGGRSYSNLAKFASDLCGKRV